MESQAKNPIDGAMGLFWAKGAETASYPEIVDATGLSRKALDRRWPDKNALIADALTHYRDTVLARMLAELMPPGRAGLQQFWDKLDHIARQPGWSGCLLFRTASGPMGREAFVGAAFLAYLRDLTQGLALCVEAEGKDHDTARLAAMQAVAILGQISMIGAGQGWCPAAEDWIAAGRRTCGV
jgi:AcrR family transcriptional regulator